jgi:excisionase family DNA binding protein
MSTTNAPANDEETVKSVTEPLGVGAEEGARLVGLSESKIWKMMASGELGFVRVGKRRIIPMTELKKIMSRLVTSAPKLKRAVRKTAAPSKPERKATR